MSFNSEIKKELSGIFPKKECCEKAVLCVFYALLSEEKNGIVSLKTENINIGRTVINLSKKHLGIELSLKIGENKRRKKPVITVTTTNPSDCEKIKEMLKLKNETANIYYSTVAPIFTINECCKKAALFAAFMAAGFVNSPKKSYHLELVTHKKRVSEDLCEIMFELSMEPKVTMRKNKYVIYIKNNEEICDFLSVIGAKRSLFQFHEVKIEKELKNRINRSLNCESANQDKVISAGLKQVKAIEKLIKTKKLETLSEDMQKTAYLRLDNPDLSLSELADLADFSITKSGLNHRLKKIVSLAE